MVELEGVACVADVPRVQARRRGGETALVFEGRARTFAEVDAMASRIAKALVASGLRTQERIAYLGKNTESFSPLPARRLQGAHDAHAIQLSPSRARNRPPP
jgi:non-ribosomal peptide synthetase component E (peptide arylation enzyme)